MKERLGMNELLDNFDKFQPFYTKKIIQRKLTPANKVIETLKYVY